MSNQTLGNFEDDDTPTAAAPLLSPRRRSRPTPTAAKSAPASAEPPEDPATPTPRRRGRPAKTPGGADDIVRRSNINLPVTLLDQLQRVQDEEGLSHGEVFIRALEATHKQLGDLINPAQVGGGLFTSRRARPARVTGPLSTVNFGMRVADYKVLDQLVEDLGASSRGHLISVALAVHFDIDLTD